MEVDDLSPTMGDFAKGLLLGWGAAIILILVVLTILNATEVIG